MKCGNCGALLSNNQGICSNCGYSINYNIPPKDNNKLYRIIILSMLCVITLLLAGVAIVICLDDNKIESRTIMVYMSGSNLETDNGIATADLESIVPSSVDLNTTNVVVYTGGTQMWHNNYASSTENSILKLTSDGFVKVQSDAQVNMGDASTFQTFLNYAYQNYKADRYDLIIYDHGLGALGSIVDDFKEDYLFLNEMKEALSNSPFNKDNKLETVLFRTCLNATSEVASVYKDYAKYMIASEEVTYGNPSSNVFSFINSVNITDNGDVYGTKFINGYKDYIKTLGTIDSTYSVIDLTKMDELESEVNDFFSSINLDNNYNEISKLRANLHQYALDSTNDGSYDTVDLYSLVDGLKSLSPKKANKLLKTIKSTVKYNWTNNEFSNGLSIYFPYNGDQRMVSLHFNVFDGIDFSKNYYSFIKKFNDMKTGTSNFSMSFSKNDTSMKNKTYTMDLTDDQVKNFSKANYVIYEKNNDNTYSLVARMDAELKDNKLVGKLTNNVIKISSKDGKTYIPVKQIKSLDSYTWYTTSIVLSKRDENNKYVSANGNMHIKVKDNKVNQAQIIRTEKDKEGGAILDTKDYSKLTFEHTKWNILDDKGNYVGPTKTDSMNVYEIDLKDGYELTLESLDNSKYYCVFEIYDVNNNKYYSKLDELN